MMPSYSPHYTHMKSQKLVLPEEQEIADFFEKMRLEMGREPSMRPVEDGECADKPAEILLNNTTSDNELANYGKLERSAG